MSTHLDGDRIMGIIMGIIMDGDRIIISLLALRLSGRAAIRTASSSACQMCGGECPK